jgi:hypothetical protein
MVERPFFHAPGPSWYIDMAQKSGIPARTIILAAFLALTACRSSETPAVEELSLPQSSSPTAVSAGQSMIWDKWQKSAHAHTYDLHKGPNTYCAQCHAPRNWDPQAVIDPPPNCVSCKFEFEDEPRIAAGNPLVPPEEWRDIRCDNCHEMNEGLADPELAWWDQAAGQYVPVADASAQCAQCHTDTETIRHRRELGNEAHADFQCTDCHDAHSTAAGCSDSECHADLSPENHGEDVDGSGHTAVSCVACHDASGLEVAPLEDGGIWTTWRTTELLGRTTTKPYQSHALGLEVACRRCHFAGNPWNLELVDE